MQITVFGASGKVGSLVVEQALKRGYTVVAFVHSHNLFSPSGNLIVRKGDVGDSTDVAAAIRGSQAVISCLGSWGTPHRNVLATFVANVVPPMLDQKIARLVTLTGIGVKKDPSKLETSILSLMKGIPAGKVFNDAEQHVALLQRSGLDWTAVCSPVMNNLGREGYTLNLKAGNPFATINRKAVAVSLLDQIESREFLSETPVIHRN